MEDEKLQLLIGLFGELKKDITDVKTDVKIDIRAVAIGQDDHKTEQKTNINDVETNVKGDISALETKINAGQEELRREDSVFLERINKIEAGQAAFEERVRIWVLVADITDELILGLDAQSDCNPSLDVGRRVLRIGQVEVSLWNPRARPRSSQLTLLNDKFIQA
jgi:hypothetical protein